MKKNQLFLVLSVLCSLLFLTGFSTDLVASKSAQPIPEANCSGFESVIAMGSNQDFYLPGENLKLTWKQKLLRKITQKRVLKSLGVNPMKFYPVIDKEGKEKKFSFGGFILGLLLGPLGIIISAIIGRNALRSSLLGFGIALVLGLALVLIVYNFY